MTALAWLFVGCWSPVLALAIPLARIAFRPTSKAAPTPVIPPGVEAAPHAAASHGGVWGASNVPN